MRRPDGRLRRASEARAFASARRFATTADNQFFFIIPSSFFMPSFDM